MPLLRFCSATPRLADCLPALTPFYGYAYGCRSGSSWIGPYAGFTFTRFPDFPYNYMPTARFTNSRYVHYCVCAYYCVRFLRFRFAIRCRFVAAWTFRARCASRLRLRCVRLDFILVAAGLDFSVLLLFSFVSLRSLRCTFRCRLVYRVLRATLCRSFAVYFRTHVHCARFLFYVSYANTLLRFCHTFQLNTVCCRFAVWFSRSRTYARLRSGCYARVSALPLRTACVHCYCSCYVQHCALTTVPFAFSFTWISVCLRARSRVCPLGLRSRALLVLFTRSRLHGFTCVADCVYALVITVTFWFWMRSRSRFSRALVPLFTLGTLFGFVSLVVFIPLGCAHVAYFARLRSCVVALPRIACWSCTFCCTALVTFFWTRLRVYAFGCRFTHVLLRTLGRLALRLPRYTYSHTHAFAAP